MMWVLLLPAVFFGDLFLKRYLDSRLEGNTRIYLAGKRAVLRKCHNSGIAGGRFSGRAKEISTLTLGIMLGFLAKELRLLFQKGKTVQKAGIALLLGGGLSNWYDRRKKGYVTDYISFCKGPKKLQNLVFNLSDFCIFAGILMALLGTGKKES